MNRPRPFRDYRWDQVHCVRLGITSITRGFVNSEFSFRRKQSFLEANQMERVIRRSRKVRSFFPSRDKFSRKLFRFFFFFFFKQRLVSYLDIRLDDSFSIYVQDPLKATSSQACLDSQLFGRRSNARASIYSGRTKVTREPRCLLSRRVTHDVTH